MGPIIPGTRVFDVRGRTLGPVRGVFHCCIELPGGRHVQRGAIFNITEAGAELICDADQLDRYSCLIHRPVAPAK